MCPICEPENIWPQFNHGYGLIRPKASRDKFERQLMMALKGHMFKVLVVANLQQFLVKVGNI